MFNQKLLYNSLRLFVICILVFNLVGCGPVTPVPQAFTTTTPTALAKPTSTATKAIPSVTPTVTPTIIPTATPTLVVRQGATPVAWLDGAVNLDQFPSKGALTVHFNTPMLPGSSANPVLVWPAMQGSARWDESNTTLYFTPNTPLDSKKTYTFFLDPALQSTSSKPLEDAPGWVVHARSTPQVLYLSPSAGEVARRAPLIIVTFDQAMDQTLGQSALTIEPPLPFETLWKDKQKLEITLKAPLENGIRYDLTLSGLFSADGSLLDDYRWFYSAPSLTATAENWDIKAIKLKFNQALNKEKSGFPFAISPNLSGNWEWISSNTAAFTASVPISAAQDYTLTFTGPLIDKDGFETSKLAPLAFTGITPVHLLNLKEDKYSDASYVEPDRRVFTIQFDQLVDHESAEKAFSLTPAAPGKFTWETSRDGTSESLIYTLNDLLQPDIYTLQIDTTVKDSQGNALLGHPFKEVFRNSEYSYTSPSFGEYGASVQLVDANGPRKLQIEGSDKDISFSVYRFDLIDFAKLYAEYYHSRHYGSSNLRDIPIPANLKSSARWTEVSTREAAAYNDKFKIFETTLPPELAPGLYILNMRVKNALYDQLFLIVSRNTLAVKNDGQNLFVWLTNINGENVPNAEVRVYSKSGEKIREGKTDVDGQYRVSIPKGVEPMLVSAHVAVKGQPDDVTISGFGGWQTSISYNYDNGDYYYYENRSLPSGQPYLIYTYTDRPIYRPGQLVNFKALVRVDHDIRYEMPPANTLVKVNVLDARNNTVESFDLNTNGYGTVNGSFTLTEGAMLGDYSIEAEVSGVTTKAYFKVQDYHKPDYQIKITSLQPEKKNVFVNGEEIKLQINAFYYFGEPLANTKLQLKFYGIGNPDAIITGPLVTDEHGDATISFPAPYNQPDYYYGYYFTHQTRLEVSAEDGSNQLVSSIYAFDVHPAAEELSIDTGGYYASPDKPIKITANVVDLSGKPVADRELTLTIEHWNWKSFDYETIDKTHELKTDAQGSASQEVTLGTSYYKLTLQGKDASGNETQTSHWLGVFKERRDWFQRSQEERITISSDQDSYKPYQKARLAIESSFSGPALLTFERGSVINTKMVQLTAPLTIVETDVIPEYAPNIYAIINAWQATSHDEQPDYWGFSSIPDSRLRMARIEIKVDSSAKALDINIQPDKKIYMPGEKVTTVIQVKDADGKPVRSELSLAVVDESIFALANDPARDIFDAFYGPRQHTVDTYNSMSPTRYMPPQMGGGGGEPEAAPRSDFPDTSAWLPVIETDAKGQATVSFDLPDNTTSWRLTAKAITLNHKVGQAQTNIETKKEVFVRPSLPRVLTSGDQAMLTALVHNYSAIEQTVTVNLAADGLEIQGSNDQQVTLKPGDVQTVGWRVTVSGAKPTDVTISVKGTDGPLDAVRLPLLLQPAAVKDVQNQSGHFSGSLTLALPLPKVERQTSLVRLTLNRSLSGTILNGLEYLTGYPYGCVEQTMSRALPNAVVGRAASQLGVGGPALQTRVAPLIKASIQKLYGLQHSDGGWGWWVDDQSDAYETAWVLFGLGLMDQSGYEIEPKVMDQAADWLKRVGNYSKTDIRTQAYALYSIAEAGRGDKVATMKLATDSIQALDPFSQAALALALDKLGEKQQAQSIMVLLTRSAMKKGDQVYWPQPSYDGEYHQKTMASTTRTTALVLLAYMRIEPKSSLVPGIVTYLAEQRQGINGWGTTNETSYTILALTEYFKAQDTELGSTPYEVSANGKDLFHGTLEAGDPSAVLDIPMRELKDGLNSLLVTTKSDKILFYDLSTNYDLLQSNPSAAGKINVKRSYLDPETQRPLTEIHAGQLVKVTLDVDVPETASFVAVEDHLPGGLEALNEGLSAVSVIVPGYYGDYYDDFTRYYWKDYGYNYKEIRGDRVVFFITTFEKGSHTFSYYARATNTGQFTTLPTQVYAMYDLSMWGRSDIIQVQIK